MYGNRDSVLFPRLGNREKVFTVWSAFDPLLLDQDQDGKEDINQLIEDELEDRFGQRASLNLFSDFIANKDISSGSSSLGKILKPFIDSGTGLNFCPTAEQYNGKDPLFNILRDYLSVDTEPLFLAERENVIFDNGSTAPKDFLYVSLSEIKDVWFYFTGGQHLTPSLEDRFNRTLHFYWPLDKNSIRIVIDINFKKSMESTFIDVHHIPGEEIRDFVPLGDLKIGPGDYLIIILNGKAFKLLKRVFAVEEGYIREN